MLSLTQEHLFRESPTSIYWVLDRRLALTRS